MLVSFDQDVKAYIKSIMRQLSRWMLKGKVKTLVLVISSKDSGEHLERWQFDVQLLSTSATAGAGSAVEAGESVHVEAPAPGVPEKEKTEKEIQMEIQALFRNIHASVAILPMLDGRCTFTVLVYADGDVEVPMEWGDSDAKEIADGEKMAFRSWGTSSHRIDSLVSYRLAH
jgi:mitotic spindle assembly checkpoint protein MAD2